MVRAVIRLLAILAISSACAAQVMPLPSRITLEIDSTRLIPLHGTVRADLTPDRDLGPVEDGLQLRLYLTLQRSPEQQAALENLLARQQQPTAAEYHKWLTPQQYGERFGASPPDIAKISAWLESQGMHVNGVMNSAMFIDFSASARQLREVFQTQLHYYNIRGGKYAANAQDPMIPAALENVVGGIKGLSRIPPRFHHTKVRPVSYDFGTHLWHNLDAAGGAKSSPALLNSDGTYDVTPQDLYTIYNVGKVFSAGNLGASATVAVIEESDIEFGTVNATTGVASGGDVATFRQLFGVPGSLNMHVYHGYGSVTCAAPGIDPNDNGEEAEAALDAEWANALAPSSNLIFMSCDQYPDDGIFTSMLALIDNGLGDVMSLSYGDSELDSPDYSWQDPLYSQAAAQGQSFIVSAGDSGSDVYDQNTMGIATAGINVNAFGAPNVTVAGGTDFSDLYDSKAGGPPQSSYWGAANSNYYSDAMGYIPETVWNDSCAGLLAASNGYTGAAYCGTGQYAAGDVVGGSGGFSTHYAVPSYQSGITGYFGTMRAQPDISGFAANGVWGHYLIFCDSYANANDPSAGDVPCTSFNSFGGAGGTSFVAPYMAGVTGLLVNATGSRQGLLNPALYALAKTQFTAAATKTACYSNGQTSNTGVTTGLPAAGCIFNDVTTGNNDVPCAAGSTNCYVESGSYGVLSLTSNTLTVAYPATPGYDEATGIGSVNVYNLIANWNTAFTSTTALTASPTSISTSQSTTLSATVTPGLPPGTLSGSTYTPALNGSVSFSAGTAALGKCTLKGGNCTLLVSGSALQSGANSISATFMGSNIYPASTSSIATVTVTSTAASTTTAVTASPTPVTYGGTATLTATVTPTSATGPVTFKLSSLTLGTATISGGKATLSAEAVTAANGFSTGSNSITASYGGDASHLSSAGSTALTVSPATLTVTVNDTSKLYGAANPDFTGTITGLVNGDAVTASYSSMATGSSPVGMYPITATLSDPNDRLPNYSVTITNGALVIYDTSQPLALWLSSNSATAGGGGFTLTVTGANFRTASLILWNGAVRTTTHVSNTQLKAAIGAVDIAKEATDLVTVANPAPNAGTSSALPFVVISSAPVAAISGVTIAAAADGSGNQVLTLISTDFVSNSTAEWNGVNLTTSYVSPWQLSVVLPGSDYASMPAVLKVENPSGTSPGFVLQ